MCNGSGGDTHVGGKSSQTLGGTQSTRQGKGISFRMPNCLSRHFFYLVENSTSVRDELIRVGYRYFTELDFDSRIDGDADTVICGYMTGECPAWAGKGISFSGNGISQEHRAVTGGGGHSHTASASPCLLEPDLVEEDAIDGLQMEAITQGGPTHTPAFPFTSSIP